MPDTSITRPRAVALLATCGAACIMALATAPTQLAAQAHRHDPSHGASADRPPSAPVVDAARLDGQAAFATIAEVVRRLDADATTDWATVDLERLRAHLRDMDLVTLRAVVAREDVPGGARFTVRGDTATLAAARRMLAGHAPLLRAEQGYAAAIADGPGALRVTVTAARADDARGVARIRALGLVGLLATGDHHAAHHLAIARGDGASHAHE